MRRLLQIQLLCAVFALLLSGCASSGGEAPETPAPTAEAETEEPLNLSLRISEVMAKNHATLPDPEGSFSDWVELENTGEEPLELNGWHLSDREGEPKTALPGGVLEPGGLLLVFCGEDFSLSEGETLFLSDPSGRTVDSLLCQAEEDRSQARQADGSFAQTPWPTPGYPNTPQGYDEFCAARPQAGPVVLNEVMVANSLYAKQPLTDYQDWVELKNVSDEPVSLSGWALSDDRKDYALFPLPDLTLQPGECTLIYCSGDTSLSKDQYVHANFSLDAESETLYLTDSEGALADYTALHDTVRNGSIGRMDGQRGFFYFEQPTPGADNAEGERRVSARPVLLGSDGVFEEVEQVTAQLEALGDIYYTTDGTVPTGESTPYTGPVSLEETGLIRAVAVEEGALPSPVATFSFLLNEHHTLPVLSMAVDDSELFTHIYTVGEKYVEVPGNIALYEDGECRFNHACGISMKGWTSLTLPKKSLGASFSGLYGGNLDCDVFSNGIRRYSSLSIRAGQDYSSSIFRNELFQELSLEMGGRVLSQESKFCVLYLNAQYYGIYCLKEDFSRQYYASHAGVSKDSVTMLRTPVPGGSDFFQDVIGYTWTHDLSQPESYEYLSQLIDMDSLIDWFIIEGYSGNTDIQGNSRVFRSTENGGKWQFAAYDFDWAFISPYNDFAVILLDLSNAGNQLSPLCHSLLNNPVFRARFLERFSQLNGTVLSNAHVLELIDWFQALLEPEIQRERARWDRSVDSWYRSVDGLRSYVTEEFDMERHNISQFINLIDLTDQELETYFPQFEAARK